MGAGFSIAQQWEIHFIVAALAAWPLYRIFRRAGLPPWPVLLCFAVSHTAFCLLVASVKPYRGPYKEPMADPEPGDWPQP